MAKELPYFKFEPNQWENGLIQMCSHESKGLFIDIISIYWQRLGNLPYRYVLQKLCNGNANALQELCGEGIIKVKDDNIYIDFLDDQLNEFKDKRKSAKKSADERWRKQREKELENANAMRTHNEGNAIREDKIRIDNSSSSIKPPPPPQNEDRVIIKHVEFKTESLKPTEWKEMVCIRNKIDPDKFSLALKDYNESLIEYNQVETNLKDYQTHFVNWIKKTLQYKKK